MQQKISTVATLNEILTLKLTSINHYFLHARMFRNWQLKRLDEASYKKSIKDMKQADDLINRILLLDGLPNLQQLNPLMVGEHTQDMLDCDEKHQKSGIEKLKAAITVCEGAQDFVSRTLLEAILEYEENFLDWVEAQTYQINKIGIKLYIQAQISEGDD